MNRWLKGLLPVNFDIGKFYHESRKNREKLAKTLKKEIFPCLSDGAMAVQEVYRLLMRDGGVSWFKKRMLCGGYPKEKNADEAVFWRMSSCSP